MKKILVVLMAFLMMASVAMAAKSTCTTIQDGTLKTSDGSMVIPMGFITEGKYMNYNYQAHLYNGWYDDTNYLVMKWNDAWLSNKDCDGDGLLDRPLDENGAQYYFGSGAWLTNHWVGTYNDGACYYEEFIKIVALPVDAELVDGYWFTADGVQIGASIWGQFAIIQDNYYDTCGGSYSVLEAHPGFGFYK